MKTCFEGVRPLLPADDSLSLGDNSDKMRADNKPRLPFVTIVTGFVESGLDIKAQLRFNQHNRERRKITESFVSVECLVDPLPTPFVKALISVGVNREGRKLRKS
jgi:hypothetical protein